MIGRYVWNTRAREDAWADLCVKIRDLDLI